MLYFVQNPYGKGQQFKQIKLLVYLIYVIQEQCERVRQWYPIMNMEQQY